MTPRRAMTMFLLAISTTAAAQVLDDDLEFENHVATIVLDENSPVIEGVGPSREITYECHFEGALYLSVMADAGVDPILRIEDLEGKRVAQDDDSGGGKHAFVRLQVKGGETLVCRVAVKGRARAGIRFKLFEAKESEVTRAAAAEGVRALAEARRRRQAGELDDARKCLRRAVTALQAVPGGDASTLVADILWDIGFEAWQQLGDLAVARDALAQTEANRESILPSDHPDLQRVRLNLALMYKVSGDLAAGRELEEKALEACSRTLPEEHPDLLRARSSLAATMLRLGDLEGARVLQEKVLAARLRTLPDDHDDLQRARGNLAETIKRLGDLRGARALDEKVLEVYSRTLPDDHPDLQTARSNLATTIAILGDLPGARVLLEKVFDVCSRRFPDDHPDLQRARFNLAAVMYLLGNLQGARELFEKVFDVCSHTLPDDHPDLQGARLNLAAVAFSLGNLQRARELFEKVFDVCSRRFPDDHPDLQLARLNLAAVNEAFGDCAGASALLAKVLEVRTRTLPDGHPDLQLVRRNVARTRARLDACMGPESVALARATIDSLERLNGDQSGREVEVLALMQKKTIDWILSLELTGQGEDFRDLAFRAVEAVRSVAAARERLLKSVVIADDMTERARRLEQELAREAAVTRQGIFEDRGTPKPLFQDPASFLAHILERDRLEREVAALYVGLASQQGLAFHADRQAIAGALPPGSVAVGYWCYSVERVGSKTQQVASPVASYLAFVLRPDGSMARVELGPAQAIEDALKEYRDAIGVAGGRGTPLVAQLGTEARERDVGERLRALVLDPLLPHLGNAKRLIIAPDDVLHLIPLAALPLDRGAVAARYDIELRTSLKEITVSKQPTLNPPSLLALGGIAYDHSGGSTAGPVASAEGIVRGATRDAVRAGPWELGFVPLPETRGEVVGVDALFRTAFEHAPGDVLLGEAATRDALAQFAPKARFVHLATHGYFTPESVAASIKDDRSLGARASPGRIMPFDEQVRGFAPMELCGLAFAGANLPPDRYGFIPGVMTASEIARLDLRRCELVVLSACDTNVGVRRAGQGIASLQQAVYAAGARASLTSLWKVPDEATRELMIDFYRRMWIERKPKRQALFESQEKMRTARDERGRPKYRTRDWAAWVLVGEE